MDDDDIGGIVGCLFIGGMILFKVRPAQHLISLLYKRGSR